MNIYRNYYKKIHQNLATDKTFYINGNQKINYFKALVFAKKILFYLRNHKKKLNVYTYSNKSFEMYASIFPILISGCKWIPLSLSNPTNRIEDIINLIKPDILFYDHDNSDVKNLFLKNKSIVIPFKKIKAININKTYDINIAEYINKLDYNSDAFYYLTSGSTGTPKAIKISHKNIISDTYNQINHLYGKDKHNLIFGDYYDTAFSIFFDIYFPAIFLGSAISPSIKKKDSYLIHQHVKKNKINVLVCVPSTIQRLKIFLDNKKFKHIFKIMILTGEPFYLDLMKYIFKNFKFQKLFNCYGGTEMSNWITYHRCKKTDLKNFSKLNLVPIGKSFKDAKIHIKNGELIVTGPMVSKGYIDKKQNIGKFKFGVNLNTFFTGDSVFKKNGVYICKGRKDNMIKKHGYRIELSEIESILRKIKFVNQGIVFENKNKNYNNYITAVISLRTKTKEENLRNELLKLLPQYMIPKKIIIIKSLPINNNGKIDRKKIIDIYSEK